MRSATCRLELALEIIQFITYRPIGMRKCVFIVLELLWFCTVFVCVSQCSFEVHAFTYLVQYLNLSISNFERRKLTHKCRSCIFIKHEFLHMQAYASFLPPLSPSRAISLPLLSQSFGRAMPKLPRGLMT